MDAVDAAQAKQLIRALRGQLHQMTNRLVWLESRDVTGSNPQASDIHREAAALRLDISEAQFLIDGLLRRYLNGDRERPPASLPMAVAAAR